MSNSGRRSTPVHQSGPGWICLWPFNDQRLFKDQSGVESKQDGRSMLPCITTRSISGISVLGINRITCARLRCLWVTQHLSVSQISLVIVTVNAPAYVIVRPSCLRGFDDTHHCTVGLGGIWCKANRVVRCSKHRKDKGAAFHIREERWY